MIKVGGEVDAFCTRCGLDLAHTIIAIDRGQPVKVECNTCHAVHRFRGRVGGAAPRAARAERVRAVERSFDEALAARTRAPVPYSPRRALAVDDVVDHPVFGRGFVSAVRGDKAEITFRADVKTLVHGRP